MTSHADLFDTAVEALTGLRDLFDADKRIRDTEIRDLAIAVRIPHPLRGVQYGDGIGGRRHARKHTPEQTCPAPFELASAMAPTQMRGNRNDHIPEARCLPGGRLALEPLETPARRATPA
jgi:hypothetical protein